MDFDTKFYSAGVPLAATVHIPGCGELEQAGPVFRVPDGMAGPAKKYPVVVLCHGQARNRNDGLDALAERLGDAGIASLRFDHRGCGSEAVNRYRLRPITEMPFDTRCAIYFCESLGFTDRDRIGVSGISMGGVMSIIMAATDPRVKSIAAMGTPADCGAGARTQWGDRADEIFEMLREDARINAATGHSRIINRSQSLLTGKADPESAALNILDSIIFPGNNAYNSLESIFNLTEYVAMEYINRVKCPAFIIHGEDDELLPAAEAEMLYNGLPECNKNKKLKVYPGVDHNIPICDNREAVFKDIVDWFVETL